MAGRLIVGNLDCEATWARAARGERGASPVSPAALERATAAGAWLAAFGARGDRLWLPAIARDPARAIAARFGVSLESGPLSRVAPAAAVLAWGETEETFALRARSGHARPAPACGALHRDLWSIAPVAPEVARAAADRRLGYAVAGRIGALLPGARPIDSIADLERAIAGGVADFVLKPPHAAAGRDRLLHRGPFRPEDRARAERLLARAGQLLLEPWLDRTHDVGQCGVIGDDVALLPPHRAEVDPRGVFRAAIVGDAGLTDAEAAALARATAAVGEALRAIGYRGPFNVDGFRYRTGDTVAFHPLCEANARLSFGLVARAVAEHGGEALSVLRP